MYKCESDLPLDQQMRNIKLKKERMKLIESGKTDKRLNIPTIKKDIKPTIKTMKRKGPQKGHVFPLKEKTKDVIFLYSIGFTRKQIINLTGYTYKSVDCLMSKLKKGKFKKQLYKFYPKNKPTKSIVAVLDLIFSGANIYKISLSTNKNHSAISAILNKITEGYYRDYIFNIKDKKICDEVKKHLIKKFL